MSDETHDVLVVGAGIGGLTAAALAARDGHNVLVVEGHSRVGGCASDFPRRGLLFPAGATLISGFEEGGLHRWVYERLDIPIRARPLELAMTVLLPDRRARIWTGTEAWQQERRRVFPELGTGGERFWRGVARLAGQAHRLAAGRPALPIASLSDARLAIGLMRPDLITAVPALARTVGDLLRGAHIDGDRAHRGFVDGQLLISMQCLADACVALNGALALELYRFGSFHLEGGTASIARDLASSLQASGGAIRLGTWVRSLAPDGELWRATLATGEERRARTVISNVPAVNLVQILGAHAPVDFRRRAQGTNVGWGAMMLYAAIDTRGLAGPLPTYHQTLANYDAPLEEGNSCFVSAYPADQERLPHLAPLTVSTHTRVEPWWSYRDRALYASKKQEYGERLLAAAEAAIPDVRGRIAFSEVATPRSFRRWTDRYEGRVGGVPQTRRYANFAALSHRVGPPDLFMCGDTVFPGQGTIGVTLSGINAWRNATAHAALRRRRRLPRQSWSVTGAT